MGSSYTLPQKVYGNDLPAEVTLNGILDKGETYPYTSMKEIRCSNQEVAIEFHDESKPDLIFEIDERSAHQLLNLPMFISKHMRQTGVAEYEKVADKRFAGEKIINAPVFNFSRLRDVEGITQAGA